MTDWINPLAAPNPRFDDRDMETREPGGFLREVRNPDPRGGDSDAYVDYFPPLESGNRLTRPKLRFGIHLQSHRANPPYMWKPYFYELTGEVTTNTDGRHPSRQETLTFYLDRDVQVVLPSEVLGYRSPDSLFCEQPEGYMTVLRDFTMSYLRVNFRRYQELRAVPQSVFDSYALGTRNTQAYPVYPRPLVALTMAKEETEFGCLLRFQTEVAPIVDGLPGDIVTTQIAELELSYWNMEHPGAYRVRSTRPDPGPGPLRVDVVISRNVRAVLRVNWAGRDLMSLAGGTGLAAWLRGFFADFVDLRMSRVSRVSLVPRPDDRRELDTESVSASEVPSFLEVETLTSAGRNTMFDVLSIGVGFIPIIGDLYDIGELVHALAFGRDIQGHEVSDEELAIMAIALLPGVPSALRHLENRVSEARTLIRASRSLDDARELVIRARPALARVLRAASGDAALQLLLEAAGAQRVISHGQVRTTRILDVIRRSE